MSAVLAFDCAISGLGAAIVRDGSCLASMREEGRDQAAGLFPALEAVLRDAGIGRRELSLIAVTVGPGRFTGVRLGLAAARGLALGLGVPLAGITTTSVLISQAMTQAPARGRLVVAAVDSRLGDWFCAIGEGTQSPFAAAVAELAGRLRNRPCVVVGPGIGPLVTQLSRAGIDVAAMEAFPDPVMVARLGIAPGVEAWREGNRRDGLPGPLYLRGVSITLPDGARRTVD
jgi:tRNA threonylcarbamoyladenosine biosynthesis protein TsaB